MSFDDEQWYGRVRLCKCVSPQVSLVMMFHHNIRNPKKPAFHLLKSSLFAEPAQICLLLSLSQISLSNSLFSFPSQLDLSSTQSECVFLKLSISYNL